MAERKYQANLGACFRIPCLIHREHQNVCEWISERMAAKLVDLVSEGSAAFFTVGLSLVF